MGAQPYDFRFRLLPHDHHALDERVHNIERGEVIVHFADAEMYTYLSAIGNASALRSQQIFRCPMPPTHIFAYRTIRMPRHSPSEAELICDVRSGVRGSC